MYRFFGGCRSIGYYEKVTKSKVDDDDGCKVRTVSRLDVSGLGLKCVPNRSLCRASSSWSRSTAWIHRGRRSRGIYLFERHRRISYRVHDRDSAKCIEFAY